MAVPKQRGDGVTRHINRSSRGKLRAAFVVSCLLVGGGLVTTAGSAAALARSSHPTPVVFLAPHQDDESLWAAVYIRRAVDQGHPVWVMLATNGAASAACPRLGLSPAECTVERDKEFARAATALGVPASHVVYLEDRQGERFPDGHLSSELALEVVAAARAQVSGPTTWVTTAPTDPHPDHAALGQAVGSARLPGKVVFTLKPGQATVPGQIVIHPLTPSDRRAVREALDAYRPSACTIGVGWESVPRLFAEALLYPTSRYYSIARK